MTTVTILSNSNINNYVQIVKRTIYNIAFRKSFLGFSAFLIPSVYRKLKTASNFSCELVCFE
jgi:hypothetical protein